MKLGTQRKKVVTEAKGRKSSFLNLATSLLALKDRDPGEFKAAYTEAGLSRRSAYYLVEVAERLRPFNEQGSRLEEIGWTKLGVIAKHLTQENVGTLLKLAEENTAHRLKSLMRDESPHPGTRTVLLHFSPEEYEQFEKAVLSMVGEGKGGGYKIRKRPC